MRVGAVEKGPFPHELCLHRDVARNMPLPEVWHQSREEMGVYSLSSSSPVLGSLLLAPTKQAAQMMASIGVRLQRDRE